MKTAAASDPQTPEPARARPMLTSISPSAGVTAARTRTRAQSSPMAVASSPLLSFSCALVLLLGLSACCARGEDSTAAPSSFSFMPPIPSAPPVPPTPWEASSAGGSMEAAAGAEANSVLVEVPKVPFCRADADVVDMWLPVWDSDDQQVATAKRVVVYGGRGIDYYNREPGEPLSYLSDLWALHITNTGFRWDQVVLHGLRQPSPRWQTGSSVAFGRSLVIYGGDDETTNGVGGLGDLWVYSPRPSHTLFPSHKDALSDEWKLLQAKGDEPGDRRDPSLTLINSTVVLQGGKVKDGEADELCDPSLFLLDVSDPEMSWLEGAPLPGDCAVGQTMDTVYLSKGDESSVRAIVFGGCQRDNDGNFVCDNDLHAYDLWTDEWETIAPKSDADAGACEATGEMETAPANDPFDAGSGDGKGALKNKKKVGCPGKKTARPLGRYAHASAYIESKVDSVHALYIFGGRENTDELRPLGDLWKFDFQKMRWSEITPDSKKAPVNRFSHSLTVWQGGAGDGIASLVVFGGQTITRTGQTAYMNDVWLYTPHTGAWREVSRSDCSEGASGIVRGGNWTALIALASLLVLVVVVQLVLHRICPHYEAPRRRRRRRRRRTDEGLPGSSSKSDGLAAGDEAATVAGGAGVKQAQSAPLLSEAGAAGQQHQQQRASYQSTEDASSMNGARGGIV